MKLVDRKQDQQEGCTMIGLVLVWFALCGVAAYIAGSKGRSGVGLFFLSFFLSPLVGIIVALAMRPNLAAQGMKKCPNCAEFVQPDARICRFCQYSFAEAEAAERVRLDAEKIRLAAEREEVIAREQAENEARLAAEAGKPWVKRNAEWIIGFSFLCAVFVVGIVAFYIASSQVPQNESHSAPSMSQIEKLGPDELVRRCGSLYMYEVNDVSTRSTLTYIVPFDKPLSNDRITFSFFRNSGDQPWESMTIKHFSGTLLREDSPSMVDLALANLSCLGPDTPPHVKTPWEIVRSLTPETLVLQYGKPAKKRNEAVFYRVSNTWLGFDFKKSDRPDYAWNVTLYQHENSSFHFDNSTLGQLVVSEQVLQIMPCLQEKQQSK